MSMNSFDLRWRVAALAGVVAAAGACGPEVVRDDGQTSREVSPLERYEGRGEVRTGTFVTSRGTQRLRYELIDGQRVFEGDILLPASEEERATVDRGTLSAGRSTSGYRWSDNTIPYRFESGLSATTQSKILAAMDHWEQNTSIRFVTRTTESDFVEFQTPSSSGTCSSQVGRMGGMQSVQAGSGCTTGNFIHEIGHAVGLWHEQTRADRGSFVTLDTDCIESGKEHNFDQYTDGVDYGLYDFSSVMEYSSTSFLASPVPASCENGSYTLWRRSSAAGSYDTVTYQRDGLSFIDRQGVEEMYNDGFGEALVVADFNGDGYRDVAVGAPRRGSVSAGHVMVFRGSASGLTLDMDIDQGVSAQSEDRFGYALAYADFNNDGYQDLAIGVPGEDDRKGRVVIYKGRGAGNLLSNWQSIDETGLSAREVGDRFGYALAAGDFDGDGDGDLAVGAPGEGWSGAPTGGAVFLYRGGSSGMSAWDMLGQAGVGTSEPGDSFGAALADADLDGDGDRDLVVGAPHERYGTDPEGGVVYLFKGGVNLTAWRTLRPLVGATSYNDWDLFFGFAVSTGDYNHDGYKDVAVGAPGATVSGQRWAGRVIVYLGSSTGPSAGSFTLTQSSPSMGAAFGYSVTTGTFNSDSYSDLAVGAPGGEASASVASGQVVVYAGRSASPQLSLSATLTQSSGSTNEAGDRFGSDVDFGDIDGDGDADLVAGAMGERWGSANEGRAYTFRSNGSSLSAWSNIGP